MNCFTAILSSWLWCYEVISTIIKSRFVRCCSLHEYWKTAKDMAMEQAYHRHFEHDNLKSLVTHNHMPQECE